MIKRPMNAEQIRRLSDTDLEAFLNGCESRSDVGILYQLACDEEIAREDRGHISKRADQIGREEETRWC